MNYQHDHDDYDAHDDLYEHDADLDAYDSAADLIVCPDCGAEVHADAEACHDCGYWITEADRSAAWRANSSSGKIVRFGWGLFAAAVAVAVVGWLLTK